MISAVICGNIGKDSEVRDAGGSKVCSFNVASSTKVKGEDVTTWVRCSMFGKRGETLSQYLTKGSMVAASGTLSTREYEGKTYLELNVSDIKLMGGNKSGGGSKPASGSSSKPSGAKTGGGGFSDQDYGGDGDDIPFIANVSCNEREAWWG